MEKEKLKITKHLACEYVKLLIAEPRTQCRIKTTLISVHIIG